MDSLYAWNLHTPATDSNLDLWLPPQVLVNYKRGFQQTIGLKTNNPDGSVLEFEFEGAVQNVISMKNIYLQAEFEVDQKNPKRDADGNVEDNEGCFVNNILHSLFSNVEITLQHNAQVFNANNLYPFKALVENELSQTTGCKETILIAHGYSYEKAPEKIAANDGPFHERRGRVVKGETFSVYGRLAIDFFDSDKYLLPGVHVNIKLIRAPQEFVIISLDETKKYAIRMKNAKLRVHFLELNDASYVSMQRALEEKPACYRFFELVPRSFIITNDINLFEQDDIFNCVAIRRMVILLNVNTHVTGDARENPFYFRKFDLSNITITREGAEVGLTPYKLGTGKYEYDNLRLYNDTIEALGVQVNGNGIPFDDFITDHFTPVFALTADLNVKDGTSRPELTGGRINIKLEFSTPLEEPLRLIVLGERESAVYINSKLQVQKNTQFTL